MPLLDKDKDSKTNLIIKGDNIKVLKKLLPDFNKKVKKLNKIIGARERYIPEQTSLFQNIPEYYYSQIIKKNSSRAELNVIEMLTLGWTF